MKKSFDLRLHLQPKEIELINKIEAGKDGWIGYGGARGGMKSHSLRAVALYFGFKYNNIKILIFRRTYPLLWENHIMPLMEEWPFMRRYYNEEQKVFRLPTGSKIIFRYADTLKDLLDFKGREYALVMIDEATDLTEGEIRVLSSCCRSISRAFTPKRILTFNPGGVGHVFVKRLFVDREMTDEEGKQGVDFIQSFPWDNALWSHDLLAEDGYDESDYHSWEEQRRIDYFLRSEYGRELLSNSQYTATWLWGRWDVLAGAYFNIWKKELHTIKPAELRPEAHWKWWIGMDWGFVHATAVIWFCTDGTMTYSFREWCQSGLTPTQIADGIVKGTKAIRVNDESIQLEAIFLSPDAFAQHTSDRSIAVEMSEVLEAQGLPAPLQADNDRIGGWQLMYDMLRDGRWRISEACEQTIRMMPLLQRNPESKNALQQEDILKVTGDDAPDAQRYGVKTRPPAVALPRERLLAATIKAATGKEPNQLSPTWRAIAARDAELQLEESETPIYLRT